VSYIILSIIGLFAVLCVRNIWKKSAQIAFILVLLLLGLVGIIIFERPFFQDHGAVSKGKTLSDIPWFEISLYFVMLLGMAAKYCYDAIGEGSNLNFQKWQLFKPMLVSPMVFGAIYGNMGDQAPRFLLLIFSFQNGFFWKTVLDKTPQGRTTHSPSTVPLNQPPPQSSTT
jgi:hypothetical protein